MSSTDTPEGTSEADADCTSLRAIRSGGRVEDWGDQPTRSVEGPRGSFTRTTITARLSANPTCTRIGYASKTGRNRFVLAMVKVGLISWVSRLTFSSYGRRFEKMPPFRSILAGTTNRRVSHSRFGILCEVGVSQTDRVLIVPSRRIPSVSESNAGF